MISAVLACALLACPWAPPVEVVDIYVPGDLSGDDTVAALVAALTDWQWAIPVRFLISFDECPWRSGTKYVCLFSMAPEDAPKTDCLTCTTLGYEGPLGRYGLAPSERLENAEAITVGLTLTGRYYEERPWVLRGVFAHEIGHALGLRHSLGRGDLMSSRIERTRNGEVTDHDVEQWWDVHGGHPDVTEESALRDGWASP